MNSQLLKLYDLSATACYGECVWKNCVISFAYDSLILFISVCICSFFLISSHLTHINNIKSIVGLNSFPVFHALFEMNLLQQCNN